MKTFQELEDRYNTLSWLEDADPANFTKKHTAISMQREVTFIFSQMNELVRRGTSSDEDGSRSHQLLNDAVTLLEALKLQYKGVLFG